MKFWRRRFRKRLSERVFDFRHSRQDRARATTFHCRPRKYAINFCLCLPRGNANTRGDFAGVIRKCRGIPRALCCLFPFSPSRPFSIVSLFLSHSPLPLLSISFPLKLYPSLSKCFVPSFSLSTPCRTQLARWLFAGMFTRTFTRDVRDARV